MRCLHFLLLTESLHTLFLPFSVSCLPYVLLFPLNHTILRLLLCYDTRILSLWFTPFDQATCSVSTDLFQGLKQQRGRNAWLSFEGSGTKKETNFKPWVSESECPQISERKLWVEILTGTHTFNAHDLHCGDCTILLCFSLTNTDMALLIFQHYSKCFTSINSFHLEILIFGEPLTPQDSAQCVWL